MSSAYSGLDIYCDLIIPGKLPVTVVAETEHILAFYHTAPYWPVHIVVTPKRHFASVLDLPSDSVEAKELLQVVQEVAAGVYKAEGACRINTNVGDYQDSKHLHIHVGSGARVT